MTVVSVTLDPESLGLLDALATGTKANRSETVRQLIHTKRKAVGLRAAEQQGKQLARQRFLDNREIERRCTHG